MGQHYIFHVDVNSAFLSWTAVKRLQEDPNAVDLRTIPSAVGGDIKTRHGIITARSLPAKKYGIKTAEPVVKALQKCPDLVMVRSDFKTYREFSHKLMDILRSYTDLVQQVSIDEAYLDVTAVIRETVAEKEDKQGYRMRVHLDADSGSADSDDGSDRTIAYEEGCRQKCVQLADDIRKTVRETLGFTVNVGISVNKLLAKTASDFQKPDRTHTLFPEEIRAKFWPLPIGDLHGCGPASARKLEQMGIRTVGDAAATDLTILCGALGDKGGSYIWTSARGQGSTNVKRDRDEVKGYSNETTLSEDIDRENFEQDMPEILQRLADKVSGRLQKDAVFAYTVGVMVKTDDFRRHSRQLRLPDSTGDSKALYEIALDLLRQMVYGESGIFSSGRTIRLVGISTANLDKGEYRQLSLFDLIQDEDSQINMEDKK